MSKTHTLIMAGNPNMAATVNAILCATQQLRVDTGERRATFIEAHIFHSEQSFEALTASPLPWKEALHRHGVAHTALVHHVIDLEEPTAERFADLIGQLKTIVNPLQNTQYYVDLTNGVSALKAILAVFAYVLDIQNVYTMEVAFVGESEDRRRQTKLFLDQLTEEPGVTIDYHPFPSISDFDAFGRRNYTEVLRYQRVYGEFSLAASRHSESIDRDYLKSLLLDGANSRLLGEDTGDPAHYRHAIFSFAAAVEELAKAWLDSLGADNYDGLTLGKKLAEIRQRLHSKALYFVDEKTLEHLTILLNTLRNEVVHAKSPAGRNVEIVRLQANLVRQLTEAFGAFVLGAVTSFVDHRGNIIQPIRLDSKQLDMAVSYYFGLDGDGTGEFIESAFHNYSDADAEVRRRSKLIAEAIDKVSNLVRKRFGDQAILFAEGDNLLFMAEYSDSFLVEIEQTYKEVTGLRCSIGYGMTPYEASIALKLAKAEDAGVVGVKVEPLG